MGHWAQDIDYEDLLEGDAALVHEHLGPSMALALMERLHGHTLYLSASILWEMRARYVAQNPHGETAKEMAVRLGVSKKWVYDVLRDEATASNPLFTDDTEDHDSDE